MNNNSITRTNGSVILIAFILLVVIGVFVGVDVLNGLESNKFIGEWQRGSETWVFGEDGSFKRSIDDVVEEGTYKIEKGRLFIHYANTSDNIILQHEPNEFVYYFSADGSILELHFVILDGFTTLTKIK